jgi:predicted RND superfamily exporter protein
MWLKIANLILKNRIGVFVLVGCISLFMIWSSFRVRIAYNDMKVLPGNDSASIYYSRFKSRFGEDGSVMVLGINSPKIHQIAALQKWAHLADTLKKFPGLTGSLALTNLPVLHKDTLAHKFTISTILPQRLLIQKDADLLWENYDNLPFYHGFIVGRNQESTLMAVSFNTQLLNDKERLLVVDKIIHLGKSFEKETGIQVHYSGLPYIRSMISQMVLKEFILFLSISLLTTAFILFVLYRSLNSVIFPMIIVMIGVVWSLGLMVIFGFKITLLTGIIPPIVVVIGVPNSILLINKYRIEYDNHGNKIQALTEAASSIGFTIFIANITTAIGFGVFYFTQSQILIEFGIIAFLSIMGTYLLSLLLIPTVFSFLAPLPPLHPQIEPQQKIPLSRQILSGIMNLVQNYRPWIYGMTLFLILMGFWGMSQIKVNGYIVDDLPKNDRVLQDLKFFENQFIGVLPFEVSIDTKRKNGIRNLDLLNRMESLEQVFASYPIFSKPLSLDQIIKYAKQTVYNGNPKRYSLPSREEVGFILGYFGKIPKSAISHAYIDSDNRILRMSFQMADIGSSKMNTVIESLQPKVDSIFPSKRYNVQFTGSSILFIKGTNYLVKNLFQSLALAILLISIIMIYLFRTPKMVLISLVPNLIPLVLTAGIMGFLGINLKPTTILIFSIAFGLASDQTIYFLTKFRSDLNLNLKNHKNLSISSLVNQVIFERGMSMIYTALILFFGFSIFEGSKFGGTVSLGLLVSLTMVFAILSNILLLPSLLISLNRGSKENIARET